MNKYNYRAATLYITPKTHRWLVWLAEVENQAKSQDKTADALAEEILVRDILARYPAIEQVESDYQNERAKLNDAAKAALNRPS